MKLIISGDKFTIASAHMITQHTKCSRIHGHNYDVEIEVEGELDSKNMVIDFGVFKPKVAKILKKLDHKLLLPSRSSELVITHERNQVKVVTDDGKKYRFPLEDVEFLPIEATTVELIAKYLHDLIKEEYPQFRITIKLSETPTSKVIYSEEEVI
ncbi:MAG: 6-pyruvoyl trahydropterin synthase family protein [Candidatus Heimdallarchaeaceae archaeon]